MIKLKKETCTACKGSGKYEDWISEVTVNIEACSHCNGVGIHIAVYDDNKRIGRITIEKDR